MTNNIQRIARRVAAPLSVAVLGAALAAPALATQHTSGGPKPSPEKDFTVLTFSLPKAPAHDLTFQDTVGGKLTVSAGDKQLSVSVLGALGVSSKSGPFGLGALDLALGKGEQITFSFDKPVSLLYWDLDDANPLILLPDGSNKFGLSIDGGPADILKLHGHVPNAPLVGTTFTFSYAGDGYFIDTLKFGAVTAVPEASTLAQLGLGLALGGTLVMRRRRNGV